MSLVKFKSRNHPQQTAFLGVNRSVDDRALPPEDFAILQKRFEFTIDAAASKENAKLPRFWTFEDNALLKSWAGERVYCNPPFSDIRPWVQKAWDEPSAHLIVMLLPANRTEQSWWQDLVEPSLRCTPPQCVKGGISSRAAAVFKPRTDRCDEHTSAVWVLLADLAKEGRMTTIGQVTVSRAEHTEIQDLVDDHGHLLARFGATAEDKRRLIGSIVYAYRRGRQAGYTQARTEMGIEEHESNSLQREMNLENA